MRVLTLGTWDPVHADHAAFLRRCEGLGEVVVGVNSDRFVRAYRGRPPVFSQLERQDQVEALGYEVVLNDGPGREVIDLVRPGWLVVGSDWLGRDYLKQIDVTPTFLEERDIALAFLPRGRTISATELKARIRA
jgi:cytidyltransferase-like protein